MGNHGNLDFFAAFCRFALASGTNHGDIAVSP
jgi:hypothetical protein